MLERRPSNETTHRRGLDIFLYEVGWGAETGWKAIKEWNKGDPALDPPPFDYVADLLDNKITDICAKVNATEPPTIFISGKGNFREQIAKKKGYKHNRVDVVKPFHYANIKAHLQIAYDCVVVEGMEADDAMSIVQSTKLKAVGEYLDTTIICSRDKDLRQVPGWHFGWELGKQPQFGPEFVEGFGYIKLDDKKKLRGVGEKFFYAQMLMGDPTDNIPGIPKLGDVGAFELLADTQTSEEAEQAVVEAYRRFYGDDWRGEMLEQGQLLWMVRELDEQGKPVLWNFSRDWDC